MTTIISRAPNPSDKGRTIIDHNIRIQLKLTCEEYVVLDLIYTNPGIKYQKIYDALEFYPSRRLLFPECEFVNIENDCHTTTDKWNYHFKLSETDFESFWKIAPKGSKAMAKVKFSRCLKLTDGATISEAYKKYILWADALQRFRKDTCTWLNPENRAWEDDYTIPTGNVSAKESGQIEGNFFNNKK